MPRVFGVDGSTPAGSLPACPVCRPCVIGTRTPCVLRAVSWRHLHGCPMLVVVVVVVVVAAEAMIVTQVIADLLLSQAWR